MVRHPVNLGQGAALQTGFEYARSIRSMRWVVTFDADGQHQVSDVLDMLTKARSEDLQVVFGSRFLDDRTSPSLAEEGHPAAGRRLHQPHDRHPADRRAQRPAGDPSRDVVERLDITQNRMAHASELVAQIGEMKVRYGESPVHILYTDYSKSKGQSLWNSVNILVELMFR